MSLPLLKSFTLSTLKKSYLTLVNKLKLKCRKYLITTFLPANRKINLRMKIVLWHDTWITQKGKMMSRNQYKQDSFTIKIKTCWTESRFLRMHKLFHIEQPTLNEFFKCFEKHFLSKHFQNLDRWALFEKRVSDRGKRFWNIDILS